MNYKLSYQDWVSIGKTTGWIKSAKTKDVEVHEIYLQTINNAELYRSMINPSIKSMAKKMHKGIFNKELALKQFMNIASQALKSYERDNAKATLSPMQKQSFGKLLMDYYMEEIVDASNELKNNKTAQVKAAFTLPTEISNASPTYGYGTKNFTLVFESDYDKAAYIVQGKAKSSAHQKFVDSVALSLGKSLEELVAHGERVKSMIKQLAKAALSSGKSELRVTRV